MHTIFLNKLGLALGTTGGHIISRWYALNGNCRAGWTDLVLQHYPSRIGCYVSTIKRMNVSDGQTISLGLEREIGLAKPTFITNAR